MLLRRAIIDDDERKTLLDLVVELYDIDQPVDAVLVERWKAIVGDYLARARKNKMRYYEDYVQVCRSGAIGPKVPRVYGTVCTWLRGEVIAPEDPSDLMALGILAESEELKGNASAIVAEADKVRKLHVRIGLRMNTIIRALLEVRHEAESSSRRQVEGVACIALMWQSAITRCSNLPSVAVVRLVITRHAPVVSGR